MSEGCILRVGLLGWPVEHSVSPAMHNAAFRALQLDWRYELLPTPPDQVQAAVARLKAEGYRGANVTVPHKQAVIPWLDELAGEARAIGAVNTIVVRQDRLVGHNTDAGGFLAALREAGFEPEGRRALVLGAGGAARAVVLALARCGCTTILHSRTAGRAAELARQMQELGLPGAVSAAPPGVSPVELDLARIDLLVNATPAGMWPQVESTAWPEALPLPGHWTVFDLVYNPEETRLLAQARAAGARPIGGLGMLVHQGAQAFELWTGQRAPIDVMRAAARPVTPLGPPDAGGRAR